jgi:uncharacterized secreted protein with C-terminal beta-propeller domain
MGFWLHVPADVADTNTAFMVRWCGKVPEDVNASLKVFAGDNILAYPYPQAVSWSSTTLARTSPKGSTLVVQDAHTGQFVSYQKAGASWSTPADLVLNPGQGFQYTPGAPAAPFWLRRLTLSAPALVRFWTERRPADLPRVATFSSTRSLGTGFGGNTLRTPVLAGVDFSLGSLANAGAKPVSPTYSKTNVQVENVDEADKVKTDGAFIYFCRDNRVFIARSWPADAAAIVSTLTLTNGVSLKELFIRGNQLLVIGQRWAPTETDLPLAAYFRAWGASRLLAQLYDVTDRAQPRLTKTVELEDSWYVTSRMIDSCAYLIAQSTPAYRYFGPVVTLASGASPQAIGTGLIPNLILDGVKRPVAKPVEIAQLRGIQPDSLITILSLDLGSGKLNTMTAAGAWPQVFCAERNLYLAQHAWLDGRTRTVIDKFHLSRGAVGHVAQGTVDGSVLNAFSMDEYDGAFRIATTTGWQEQSGVFVLDHDMRPTGAVTGLAPGERIYATRFMGARAYVVTFRQTDPLFVLDLSDPAKPYVAGELHIPGYSEYLHPIDANHILGIGKDSITSPDGNVAWDLGLKIGLFDVTDATRPVQIHDLLVGDRGTDSEALRDHRAFLYDRERSRLVLPVSLAEIPAGQPLFNAYGFPAYGAQVFQGAFVFDVSPDAGIVERGRIAHDLGDVRPDGTFAWDGSTDVLRSLVIDNVLYTLSCSQLKANDIETLADLRTIPFR